jgi:hypothetical protein
MSVADAQKRKITRADVLSREAYGEVRKERRAQVVALKKHRRVAVGPYAMFYFENYETMWMQIHEMLFIEKGGEEQIADELRAYNPLIPQGRELVATMMFEIDDPVRRARVLGQLGGIEETITLKIGDREIRAVPETEVERTRDGKTSSVHFLHFPVTDEDVKRFTDPAIQVVLGFSHPDYAHMTALHPDVRQALSRDFA